MNRNRKPAFTLKAGLIPLESALITAEKTTPSRVPFSPPNPDEILVTRLIENIRQSRVPSFRGLRIESPRPSTPTLKDEMAGRDA